MIGDTKFGLDVAYIEEVADKLESGDTVEILGCNNPDGLMDYISDEYNVECYYTRNARFITVHPKINKSDDLPY